ncbi:hypothetical protein MTO96_051887 [Rhipicephalus appendiculatus]
MHIPAGREEVCPLGRPDTRVQGAPQHSLDRPFEVSEIVHALHDLNGRSARAELNKNHSSFRTHFASPPSSAVRRPRGPYYQVIDGVPKCALLDPDIYRESLSFRPVKGDLVQSSFPKSGTHWVQYITQLILKGGEPVHSFDEFACNTHALEYSRHDEWKPTLPMRLFFTHQVLCPDSMTEDAKYVYVARNPWDVCVSLYHATTELNVWRFQDGTFDELFDAFLETDIGYGSYFDHVASGYALKDRPNVFFMTYEELKRDTRGMVLRLAHFLGRLLREISGRKRNDAGKYLGAVQGRKHASSSSPKFSGKRVARMGKPMP